MPEGHGFAEFASLYDKMVDWERRLARELPFYRKLFSEHKVKSVLDVACGTGRHAAALAEMGLAVTGAEADTGMLGLARERARTGQARVEFVEADFLSLGKVVQGPFDAVICVGNSFPALCNSVERVQVLRDFAGVMSADGIAIIHLLNYELLLANIDAESPSQVRTSKDGSVRYVKSFRRAGSHVEMCIEYKHTEGTGGRFVHELHPVNAWELETEMASAGMRVIGTYGDYEFGKFEMGSSEDLIMVAKKN